MKFNIEITEIFSRLLIKKLLNVGKMVFTIKTGLGFVSDFIGRLCSLPGKYLFKSQPNKQKKRF